MSGPLEPLDVLRAHRPDVVSEFDEKLAQEFDAALAAVEQWRQALIEITELPGYPLPHKAIAHAALARFRPPANTQEDK